MIVGDLAPEDRRAEHERRLEAVRTLLERQGGSAAVLTSRRTFAWLTVGGQSHVVLASETGVASLVVTRREAVVLTQNIEADRLRDEELGGLDLEVEAVPWWEPDGIDAAVRRRCGPDAATDEDLEPGLVGLRSVLAPVEHERMEAIAQEAVSAMEGTLAAVEEGWTEDEVATIAGGAIAGLRAPVLLCAADDRIRRYRHPLPGDRAIRRRVMLVLVAERHGLHVAITRFRELEPPDGELARRIEAVAEVQRALHEATRPGATLGEVFEAGRAAYAATGYPDEWQLHHQGGTIGYQGRERIATPGDETLIQPGMAFAWNPSITGAKAEETLLLGGDGTQRIVTLPG
jgi:Xaa-Pro aminopeptidase